MSHYKKLISAAKMYEQYGYVCTATKPGFKSPSGLWGTMAKTSYDTFTSNVTGMGILTGSRSGLTCVDIDDKDMWLAVLNFYDATDDFDNCMREESPTGGLHYYFSYNANLKQGDHCVNARDTDGNLLAFEGKGNDTSNPNRVAFDIRNDGGFVVCAPSIYAAGGKVDKVQYEGNPYKWIVGPDDVEGQLMDCPEWLVDLMTKKTEIRLNDNGEIVDICSPKLAPKKKEQKAVVESNEEIDTFDIVLPDAEESNDESKHTLATIEEITEGLNILNPNDYGTYAEYCNLLWSVARGTDEAGLDEDVVIDLLDEFCQKAPGYDSKIAVEKKYNQANKRDGQQSKVTFGSFRHWVKEAKIAKFKAEKASKKEHRAEVVKCLNSFDHTDPYKWNDFVAECKAKDFESKEEIYTFVAQRINRVLAKVTTGEGCFLKKDNINLVTRVKAIKGSNNNFTLTYTTMKIDKRNTKTTKAPTPVDTPIKLSEIIEVPDVLNDYTNSDYYPNSAQCPSDTFNQWEGFKAKFVDLTYERKKSIQPILDLLLEVYANNDEETYKWTLAYFREILVCPEKPTGVCLFLHSKKQGVGKNTFIDWFRLNVIGEHISYAYSGLGQAMDKHNTTTEGKVFMVVDELASAGSECRSFMEIIKTNVTAKTLHQNPKGFKMYSVKNLCNWIMMSNHRDGLNFDEYDRRFTCLNINQKYAGNVDYWNKLYNVMKSPDVADSFYTFLCTLDTTGYPNPRAPHKTELHREISELSSGSVAAFVKWLITYENIKKAKKENPSMKYKADDLYAKYVLWCKDNQMKIKARPYYNNDLNTGKGGSPLLEKKKRSSIVYMIPEIDIKLEDYDDDDEREDNIDEEPLN